MSVTYLNSDYVAGTEYYFQKAIYVQLYAIQPLMRQGDIKTHRIPFISNQSIHLMSVPCRWSPDGTFGGNCGVSCPPDALDGGFFYLRFLMRSRTHYVVTWNVLLNVHSRG